MNPPAPSRTLRARRSTRLKKHWPRYMWFPRRPIETPCTLSPNSPLNAIIDRGVAQPGRALLSGGRGRRFKSSRPDLDYLPMNLLRILVIAFAVWLLIGYVQRLLRQRRKDTLADRTAADMGRCVHCGLHLPKGEALVRDGEYFCSRQHLELHRTPCSDERVRLLKSPTHTRRMTRCFSASGTPPM